MDEYQWGIIANVTSDNILRKRAKVFLIHPFQEYFMVYGMTKGRGCRRVGKVIPLKRLANFRAAWVPEHVRSRDLACFFFKTKEEASAKAREFNCLVQAIIDRFRCDPDDRVFY